MTKQYHIWTMDAKGNSRPVAQAQTLAEVRKELTPERRKEYVYVFKWTQSNSKSQSRSKSHSKPRSAQGVYLWGCIAGHSHTNDLREQVRACLRS